MHLLACPSTCYRAVKLIDEDIAEGGHVSIIVQSIDGSMNYIFYVSSAASADIYRGIRGYFFKGLRGIYIAPVVRPEVIYMYTVV